VGKIDDPHHSKDQGQADGDQAINAPHQNPTDNGLKKKRKTRKTHEILLKL
jgi:hypothetical protein